MKRLRLREDILAVLTDADMLDDLLVVYEPLKPLIELFQVGFILLFSRFQFLFTDIGYPSTLGVRIYQRLAD